ncbi:MAG: RsmG family class I SAM-dependent methyltransferase [Acidimicrobiales bacterium]|jgi:16S rRNA (guanine527-N7)-methyltransferase
MDPRVQKQLEAVLSEARRRSLIGKAPFSAQRAHSEEFLRALSLENFDGPVVELGAGGGLPGLVLATEDPKLKLVLVDSARRSIRFLLWAIEELELPDRVEIVDARAEDLGRDERWRGRFAAVIARSFGPPGVTAECAAPLLRVGGRLIVSEPPGHKALATEDASDASRTGERWPIEGCAKLGLVPEPGLREEFGFAILRQASPCPDRFPRRPGIPSKRPLFP